MVIAALDQLGDWQVPRVAATLAQRTSAIARKAAGLGLEAIPEDQRGPHILGVRLPDRILARVIPALTSVNCFAAVRGRALRISPHLHTTDDDVERLIEGLALAIHPDGS